QIRNRDFFPIFMILPATVILVFVWGFPIGKMFQLSTIEWYFTKPLLKTFVGLKNYKTLFADRFFLHAAGVTGSYMGIAVSVELGLGFFIAHRLDKVEKGRLLFITIFLIPMIMSPVVVALFWRAWATPGFGLIGYFMRLVKLGFLVPPEGFTGTYKTALPFIIFIDIWEWTPFMVLILYSGLQSLPKDPFEAIAIDGATRWQTFTHLTFPMLRPVMLVALLFRTIDAYRAFDVIWIVTRGGPGRVTENLSVFTYKTGFREWNVGYSATSGVIMLFGALIIALILVRRVAKT
ncbi:MAG TPA: sugar ABC transporter permease, partial [Spirochaetes bacterium]|nr:sugar ABC transporter permease [Spirochaetota bacterium]